MEKAEAYANEKLKDYPMSHAITITHDDLEKMLQDAHRAGEAVGASSVGKRSSDGGMGGV